MSDELKTLFAAWYDSDPFVRILLEQALNADKPVDRETEQAVLRAVTYVGYLRGRQEVLSQIADFQCLKQP